MIKSVSERVVGVWKQVLVPKNEQKHLKTFENGWMWVGMFENVSLVVNTVVNGHFLLKMCAGDR